MRMTGSLALSLFCLLLPSTEAVEITAEPVHHLVLANEGQSPLTSTFKSGDVKWLPGGFTHTLTNTGKGRARFVTVEFKSTRTGQ